MLKEKALLYVPRTGLLIEFVFSFLLTYLQYCLFLALCNKDSVRAFMTLAPLKASLAAAAVLHTAR